MKIRNGFVSNSSSSSFILDANKYTCADVAKHMIEAYRDEMDNENSSKYEEMIERLDKLQDKNKSIYMYLYDGEQIIKDGDTIKVDATRNMDWYLDTCGWEDEGAFCELMEGHKWFMPEYENKFIGRFPTWDEEKNLPYENKSLWRCNSCNSNARYVMIDSGDVMCPACEKDPDGKDIPILTREDKLKRILKDED